jgi:4-hydroxy-tetrahydrodipicolinate reductase
MKIALIGYGKMGKEIEQAAVSSGHEIVLKINRDNLYQFTSENINKADVAIEFTQPGAAFFNVSKCFDAGIPVVVGTTGWYDQLDEIKELCVIKNGSVLYASNFSIGVNLFFELNRKLAMMMKTKKEYKVSLEEIHHTQKLDKPSGTAIALANDIISNSEIKKEWTVNENESDKTNPDPSGEKLFINSIRKEKIVGVHTVKYESETDKIEIRHEAFNRKGFADEAILAAQWLIGKKGFFEMKDFLSQV